MPEIVRKNYTNRDFDAYKEELENLISLQYPNLSNDFYESHIAIVLLELISKVGDDLSFYLDYAFNEAFIDTVSERKNIISMMKLLGYELRNRSSASVELSAVAEAYTAPLTIPAGTRIQSLENDIVFETVEDVVVTSGLVSFTFAAIEGEKRIDTFISDGTTNQLFTSTYSNVISNPEVTPVIRVDGDEWTRVSSLWGVSAGDVYELQYLGDGKISVLFGDGVHGNLPPVDAVITFEYMTGRAELGNIGVNRVATEIEGTDGAAQTIRIEVTNPEAAAGGEVEESVDEARRNGPIFFTTLHRAVTVSDYKLFCERQSGVFRASIFVDEALKIVKAYLIADGYVAPSQLIKDAVKDTIDEIKMIGVTFYVFDAEFFDYNIEGTVYVKRSYLLEDTEVSVLDRLNEYFTPTDPDLAERDAGQDVHLSDIYRLIDETDGVDFVNLVSTHRQPEAKLEVWNGDTVFQTIEVGPTSVEEQWTVAFITPTTFSVTGSISGVQAATGTVGIPYNSDTGAVNFMIQSIGGTDNNVGDRATFKTSAYLGNVTVDSIEWVRPGNFNLTFQYEA